MAVTKRIFQLSKEFERDEKEIIAFLTAQGIKVSNRLSAVNEDVYKMLKAKFMAPPEPEPAPEPAPEPEIKVAATAEPPTPPAPAKKKKKNKAPQPEAAPQTQTEQAAEEVSDEKLANLERRNQNIIFEGIKAGCDFIYHYTGESGQPVVDEKKKKNYVPFLTPNLDTWQVIYNHKFEYSDSTPARYWNSVAKLMTRAFKISNMFGLTHREDLAKMREATKSIGTEYQPREIFTDEENAKFAAQQKLLFESFGHGMGMVNDNLYDLKLKAERMKVKYERMSFLEYVTNPQDELRSVDRPPFDELVEAVTYALRGIARRFYFFKDHEERINKIVKNFSEWIDGYAKLKEAGAPAEKLEKYLELEEKFVDLVEYMSYDNLLDGRKNRPKPFDILLEQINIYRDNLDDPDAERNFKYKSRGVLNVIYKPKEYIFIFRFAELDLNVDYRPPEEIAAAEAKAKAKAAAEAKAAEEKENPAEESDEA